MEMPTTATTTARRPWWTDLRNGWSMMHGLARVSTAIAVEIQKGSSATTPGRWVDPRLAVSQEAVLVERKVDGSGGQAGTRWSGDDRISGPMVQPPLPHDVPVLGIVSLNLDLKRYLENKIVIH